MGTSISYHLCESRFRCRGDPQRDLSCASRRQQCIIIEELRKSQMQKKYPNPKKIKNHKIVPMNLHVKPIRRTDDGRTCNLDKEMKRQLKIVARDQKEDNSLRHALIHPTIQKFLKDFMVAQSSESILNFYLDVLEILALNRNCHSKDASELWRKVAYKYILDNAPEPVPLNPMHRDMIVAPLLRERNNPRPARFLMSFYAASDKLDRRALQGLYLAQHEAFLMIKADSWVLFSQSDVFVSLLRMKQVRTVLTLVRPQDQNCFSDSFFSVVGSDMGRRHGSVGSEFSGDSRRSSTGSVGNYSMNLCTQAFNMINFKDALAREKGDRSNSREGSNSNSVRNDKDKSILDSFLNGKRTSKNSGRRLLAPLCVSKVPEDMGYSTLDSKHPLTPIYLSHQKVNLEFQKYKRTNSENDEDNNTGSLTDGQNEEYSHDYGLNVEKIQIASRGSRILSVITAKTVTRCTSYSYYDTEAINNLETGCEYQI